MGGWVVCGSSLGGTNTRLYAKSHLAYGLNEMRKRIDAMVTAQASTPPAPRLPARNRSPASSQSLFYLLRLTVNSRSFCSRAL